jgi:hypothetical protein
MDDENLTVASLLATLGFGSPGANIDEALRWALVELYLQRNKNAELTEALVMWSTGKAQVRADVWKITKNALY